MEATRSNRVGCAKLAKVGFELSNPFAASNYFLVRSCGLGIDTYLRTGCVCGLREGDRASSHREFIGKVRNSLQPALIEFRWKIRARDQPDKRFEGKIDPSAPGLQQIVVAPAHYNNATHEGTPCVLA